MSRSVLDTHAIARSLTDAELTPKQADAIMAAVRQVAEQSDYATSDQFKAGQAEVRAELANLDTRLSTRLSRIEAELKSDMKLLKFGYGPVVLGLLVKLVFFP